MLYLLWYLVIGLVVVVACLVVDLIGAKTNNLDVEDYMDWYNEPMHEEYSKTEWCLLTLALMIGWLLWPLRVITFELERKARFEEYIAECEDEES